jgi:CO/xanthine dehydrogenase Mo-binding subunit
MPEISLTQAPAHARHGSNIGQPLTRREGVLKVRGEARYAADNHPPGMLHAVLAVSSIARGRVSFLDVQAASNHPGVVEVMTSANRPALAEDPDAKTNPFMFRLDVLQNDQVRYANQPIAVVIAETLEAATEGAALLSPRYDVLPARVGLDAGESFVPPAVGIGNPSEVRRPRGASMRPMKHPPSTTMRWSRTRSSQRGMAIRCRSIRRARAWRSPRGGSRDCSAFRLTRSIFAARTSAADSAQKA